MEPKYAVGQVVKMLSADKDGHDVPLYARVEASTPDGEYELKLLEESCLLDVWGHVTFRGYVHMWEPEEMVHTLSDGETATEIPLNLTPRFTVGDIAIYNEITPREGSDWPNHHPYPVIIEAMRGDLNGLASREYRIHYTGEQGVHGSESFWVIEEMLARPHTTKSQ